MFSKRGPQPAGALLKRLSARCRGPPRYESWGASEAEALLIPVQARRVREVAQAPGREVPPRAAAILRGYSEEQLDEDAKEYIAWCAERVVEAPMAHFVNDRLVLGPAAA